MDDPKEKSYPVLTARTFLDMCMNASSERYDFPFSSAVRDELQGYVKRWERVVWFGGFKKMNDDVSFRGFSMEGPGYKMLTWTCAGRVLVSVYGAKDAGHLSFVADEDADYPRTGLQSADGDIDAIGLAMGKIIDAWNKGKRPVRDDKVSMLWPSTRSGTPTGPTRPAPRLSRRRPPRTLPRSTSVPMSRTTSSGRSRSASAC